MDPAGIFPSSKCCVHQSFARYVGAGVGAAVGLPVGAGAGRAVGLGVVSEGHAAPSPREQQPVVPHGATRPGFPMARQDLTSQASVGNVPVIEL